MPMVPLTYALQFRGRATRSSARRIVADLSAPSSALVTNLLVEGIRGRFELAAGGEARLRCELVLEDDQLRAEGTVTFGAGHQLAFRTLRTAPLLPCPDPHLRQASVISEVVSGTGQLRGASGQIVSTLLVSDTGEVTDNHLGVLFVEAPANERSPSCPPLFDPA